MLHFFTKAWKKNNKKQFPSVETGNDILIYINIKRVFSDRYWLHTLLVKPKNAWIQLNTLLNKYMYAIATYIFLFSISKELHIFKKATTAFYVIPSTIYLQKILNKRWYLLGLRLVKKWHFRAKELIFCCNNKHFNQNIMTPCYSYFFFALFIFSFSRRKTRKKLLKQFFD